MTGRRSLPPDLYTEEYFLHACEGYEEFSESQGERLSRRLSAAFAAAAVTPGMKVLDVGCGRGEILRHCARLGADAYGIDYAPAAIDLANKVVAGERQSPGKMGAAHVAQADAKVLPFPNDTFDRVLMFDVVEHLFPWELDQSMAEVKRVLRSPDPASGKPGGVFIVHTAPNVWYDRYAYPVVRLVRRLMGQGARYPKNPRLLNVAANADVHVNEQSQWSLGRTLRRAGLRHVKVWLDSPPQNRKENVLFAAARFALFELPPFRYFFEREVFAVGTK